jgi:KDO2-lipid IV(A) lauroyltransferase
MKVKCLREWFSDLSDSEARRISRRTAQMTKIRFCEQMRLPVATAQEMREYVHVDGLEHLHDAMADGRGIVAPVAHFGQYELMAARLTQELEVATPAGAFHPTLRKYVVESRQAAGLTTFRPEGAARRALAELRAKKLVGIMADFSPETRELQMRVLGRMRWVLTSPARLAMAGSAPIVPLFPVRRTPWLTDGRIVIKVFPPLRLNFAVRRGSEEYQAEIRRGTAYFLDAFEEMVRAHPDEMQPGVVMGWE